MNYYCYYFNVRNYMFVIFSYMCLYKYDVMIYDVYITVSIYIYRHMERGTYNNHLQEKKKTIKLLLYSYIYIIYI